MKKLGFTLAEVLIALAIIGVIAATTLPTLVSEHKKDVWANSLSVAVSDFERAMGAMIMRDGVYNLFETEAWKYVHEEIDSDSLESGTSDSELRNFIKYIYNLNITNYMTKPSDYYGQSGKSVLGISKNEYGSNNVNKRFGVVFETKKDITYFLKIDSAGGTKRLKETDALAKGTSLISYAGSLTIDVNGEKSPNIIGRDIFCFALGDDGTLYPMGGKDYTIYRKNTYNDLSEDDIWNGSGTKYICSDTLKTSDGEGCTGRLIENGYKMDY